MKRLLVGVLVGLVITPAALQKWNLVYGVAAVSDALRSAWGHPPLAGIENPYAYVAGILRSKP